MGAPAPACLPFSTIFLCGRIHYGGRCRRGQTMLRKGSEALEENRQFSQGSSPDSGASARPPPRKHRPGFAGKGTPFLQYPGRPAGDSGGFFGFSADTRIELFGIPTTFAPGKSGSDRCFSLKQEGFKLLRLPNWGKNNCEYFVDISLERHYNTEDEPECANIPALRLETRFVSAERQTVRRVIYD